MRRVILGVCAAFCVLALPARAAPANSLHELFDQLGHCILSPGGEITLRFSLRRDGALLGKPHISYTRLPQDPDKRQRVVENLASALDRCLPAKITPSLGEAIAGRPLVLRFAPQRPETNI
jgi:hypothetical protein